MFIKRLTGLRRKDDGYFTLEGILIFPFIILVLICVVFLAVNVIQHVYLYDEAATASEQAANAWTGNAAVSGEANGQSVSLYWRVFQDHSSAIAVSSGQKLPNPGGESLPELKLRNALKLIPRTLGAKMDFRNRILYRTIQVDLSRPSLFPELPIRYTSKERLRAASASFVADPVEFIRTLDTLRESAPALKKVLNSVKNLQQDIRSMEGNKAGTSPGQKQDGGADAGMLAFSSHNEARAYLQRLVGGKLSSMDTTHVGHWRMIDALDSRNIAHQCYFGYKTMHSMEIRQQYEKDAELLQEGKISGVVWHFFMRKSDRSIGLSPELRRQLEKRGIIIVVHEQRY